MIITLLRTSVYSPGHRLILMEVRCLLRESSSLRVQAAHAAQPTVIVVRLTAEIFRDFRVRQNQEALFCQPRYHSLSDVFRLQPSGSQENIPPAPLPQHPPAAAAFR